MSNKQALTPYGILVLAFVSCGGLLFGYHTAVISGALIFFIPVFHLSPHQEGVIVSIMLLGGLVGALLAGQIANRLGRKKALISSAFLFMLGAIIIATTEYNHYQLLIGRAISGLAVGIVSVVVPLYLGEIAPSHYRGRCVSIFQLCISMGILFSFVMSYLLSDTKRWEILFVIGAFLAFLQLCVLFFIPETPVWSFTHGKASRARMDLDRLRKDQLWEENLDHMQIRHKQQWSDFLKPHMPYIFFVGVVLSMFQQVTGINAVMYYAPKIFQASGIASHSSSFVETLSLGCISCLSTIASLWLLDKKGRRILLLTGSLGMALSLGLLSYSFFTMNAFKNILTLVSLLFYVCCFAFSLGPVVWVLLSEIFPLKIRSNALSCALMLNWMANYVVSLLFPDMIHAWGGGWSFALFAAISLFAFFFIYRCIPETKGKSLEEIETLVLSGKF